MKLYDDKEYRYKNTDKNREKSLGIIENLIGFKPSDKDLKYDLSFYAGGIGVLNKLGITCVAGDEQWAIVKLKYPLVTPDDAVEYNPWREDFLWLIDNEACQSNVLDSAISFIRDNKLDFQEDADRESLIYFVEESDVNDWTVFWSKGGMLNYLYYNQG